jgi:phage repressor protein C with HTH and peptisase S24 domain
MSERPSLHVGLSPLPDPEQPAAADFYSWFAAHARRVQSDAERADVRARARAWAARQAAAHRPDADELERALRAAEQAALTDASPRRPVRLVREVPARSYEAPARLAPTLRAADACARKSRVSLGGMVPTLELGAAAGDGRDLRDTPVASWVALPPELPDGRYLAMPVEGRSMEPALRSGDLLLVQLGAAPAAGTVVVARHPEDGWLVKRLDLVTGDAYELAPTNPAFGRVRIPRDPALVLGRVVLVWRTADA